MANRSRETGNPLRCEQRQTAMCRCDVVIMFFLFLSSSVSLKVKPVSEFNVAQKQIGERKHIHIKHVNKNREEVMLICPFQVWKNF